MKRVFAAVVAVAALAALPGAASAQDGPVMKRIAETKTIVIGHREASVPFSYLDQNRSRSASRSISASRSPTR